MKYSLKSLLAVAAITVAGLAQAADVQELNFGIIATEKAGALRQMWQPFLDDMSKAVGVKVNGFYATDYAGIIEAQRFNKVQIAWYGNKSAIDAVDRANGEVFARFVDLDGTPGYYSYLITHKESGITSLDQVLKNGKDMSFGIGDPQFYFRHPGTQLLRIHAEQPRSEDTLQGHAAVEPRGQLPCGAQQAGGCRYQQQRDDREDEGEVAREA